MLSSVARVTRMNLRSSQLIFQYANTNVLSGRIMRRNFASTSGENNNSNRVAAINKDVPINIHFNLPSKESFSVVAYEGETIQSIASRDKRVEHYLACTCGGNCACSTCHVYIMEQGQQILLETPAEDELDMLDLAWGYKEGISRLGCCIRLNRRLEGLKVTIPENSNNLF